MPPILDAEQIVALQAFLETLESPQSIRRAPPEVTAKIRPRFRRAEPGEPTVGPEIQGVDRLD